MTLFEERQKRIDDAIALKEPDCIPITATGQCYSIFNAGYTMAETLYGFDKCAESIEKYVLQYKPDAVGGVNTLPGQGPILELVRPKNLVWPGAPDGRISKNSTHQFIEYSVLLEEDMDFFMKDYTGWLITKGFPAIAELFEPFTKWDFARHPINMHVQGIVGMLSTPAAREMMQTVWKISDMMDEIREKHIELNRRLVQLGFPVTSGGTSLVPFDTFSNYYRGTLDTMLDLYENPDLIYRFIDRNIEYVLSDITEIAKRAPGKWLFMPLHKGMDSFLTDQQYKEFYWPYLQRMINHIIDVGMVPYVYTEGPYNSRVKYLKDVPKGKVVYSFEEVDPVIVKKELGDTACITGIFPIYTLHYGTKQQVIDEAKRLIDILGPGGGYIFSTGAGFDHAKPENVEAMFETVKTYGKR